MRQPERRAPAIRDWITANLATVREVEPADRQIENGAEPPIELVIGGLPVGLAPVPLARPPGDVRILADRHTLIADLDLRAFVIAPTPPPTAAPIPAPCPPPAIAPIAAPVPLRHGSPGRGMRGLSGVWAVYSATCNSRSRKRGLRVATVYEYSRESIGRVEREGTH